MTLQGVTISDNVIARGSVVFIVSSTVYAYQVVFIDTSESPDLSAVQSDSESTFVAEGTTFIGFQGEVRGTHMTRAARCSSKRVLSSLHTLLKDTKCVLCVVLFFL